MTKIVTTKCPHTNNFIFFRKQIGVLGSKDPIKNGLSRMWETECTMHIYYSSNKRCYSFFPYQKSAIITKIVTTKLTINVATFDSKSPLFTIIL